MAWWRRQLMSMRINMYSYKHELHQCVSVLRLSFPLQILSFFSFRFHLHFRRNIRCWLFMTKSHSIKYAIFSIFFENFAHLPFFFHDCVKKLVPLNFDYFMLLRVDVLLSDACVCSEANGMASQDIVTFCKVDIVTPSQKLLAKQVTCDVVPGKSLLVTGQCKGSDILP